jgi:hypothetical protein
MASSLSADGFPLMVGRWIIKCPKNIADSFCELSDIRQNKYSNIGQYPVNDNWYPSGHEHGYQEGIKICRFTPPNFQLKNCKDPSFDAHQQINQGHQIVWDDPILWEIFDAGEDPLFPSSWQFSLDSEQSWCMRPSFGRNQHQHSPHPNFATRLRHLPDPGSGPKNNVTLMRQRLNIPAQPRFLSLFLPCTWYLGNTSWSPLSGQPVGVDLTSHCSGVECYTPISYFVGQ